MMDQRDATGGTESDPGNEPRRGDGASERTRGQPVVTERLVRRKQEDQEYVPVIVKRTDEALRHPDDILVAAVAEGLEQIRRPTLSLALSAVAAGLMLAFTAMAAGVATVAAQHVAFWPVLGRIMVATVYPLGFVVCLMSGAELFTEHTATAVYPVLDRQASPTGLLRLWVVVAAGNLLGALAGAGLLVAADDAIQARAGYVEIGRHLVAIDFVPLLLSALLAGWLMALGAWLILATPPTVSQIVSIYIVTFLIGLGGLHHSIAGAVEIFTAAFVSDDITTLHVIRFIGVALLGNLIGGSVFVAVLNYAHIRETRQT